MELTVQELAALVGGQFVFGSGDDARITSAASIAEARAGDVTFFGNAKDIATLKTCKATAVLVSADFAETVPPLVIRCENPPLAFSKVLARFAPEPVVFPPEVDPSAIVAEGIELGESASVRPHSVIEAGADGLGSRRGRRSII